MNYALGAIVTITVKRTDGTKLQMIMVWEGNIQRLTIGQNYTI